MVECARAEQLADEPTARHERRAGDFERIQRSGAVAPERLRCDDLAGDRAGPAPARAGALACGRTPHAPLTCGEVGLDRPQANRAARNSFQRRARAPVQAPAEAAPAAARPGLRRERLDGALLTTPDDLCARNIAPRR